MRGLLPLATKELKTRVEKGGTAGKVTGVTSTASILNFPDKLLGLKPLGHGNSRAATSWADFRASGDHFGSFSADLLPPPPLPPLRASVALETCTRALSCRLMRKCATALALALLGKGIGGRGWGL